MYTFTDGVISFRIQGKRGTFQKSYVILETHPGAFFLTFF